MDLNGELENLNEYLRTLNISAETKTNMAEEQKQRELVMQNIKLIQPFDGDANYLALYIDSIDSILPEVVPTQPAERAFYFNCILCTLRGAALDVVRREQPSNWTVLRELLVDEFGEHTPIPTLILQVSNIKLRSNVRILCEEINYEICRIKDCIKLKPVSSSTKTFLINELEQLSLKTLKRELPNHLTALINANLATSVKSAIKILKENDAFDYEYKRDVRNSSRAPHYSNNNRFQKGGFVNSTLTDRNHHYQTLNNNNFHTRGVPSDNTNLSHNQSRQINVGQFSAQKHCPHLFNSPTSAIPSNVLQTNSLQARKFSPADSNQSRIRRYGQPEPMDHDDSNFQLEASENYPQLN